ncbi:hypothetical protein HII17_08545 [Thalassotalea sp. M1531]|uniref:Cytochrome P460 domain-containing protein n=2 Tax=Thalassotalea algicola TaxID=2716224 RepID=A0A7Y0Q6P7_9GAMM|nr:hypothetical protein [Thalassotalea algicola]
MTLVSLCALSLNVHASNPSKALAVDEDSFSCINDMQPVRGFFVDNLDKSKLDSTITVAKAGKGEYPAGSVVQLVPTEVMVKHPKGTSPVTNDWEFFELAVSPEGSKFTARGYDNVINKFGGNCLDCHKKAKPQFDLICETGHGCDPIPITKEMIAVIQKTDPRCKAPVNLNDKEMLILKQLQQMLKPQ